MEAAAAYDRKVKKPTKASRSEEAEWILRRRQEALYDKDYQLYVLLTKTYNKQKIYDRRRYIGNIVENEWDERDPWMGLRP